MVTLQVEILLFVFLWWEFPVQGVNKNMVGICVPIFKIKWILAHYYLQCYRLQCFLVLPNNPCLASIYGSSFWTHIPDCSSLLVAGKWLSKPPSTTNKPLLSL